MADRDDGREALGVEDVDDVARDEARKERGRVRRLRGAAVAEHVREEHAVALGVQRRRDSVPVARAGREAVAEEQRRLRGLGGRVEIAVLQAARNGEGLGEGGVHVDGRKCKV